MTKIKLALLGAVTLFAACKDSTGVNSQDQVPAESLTGPLTTPVMQNLASGVFAQDRLTVQQSYLVWADVIARDVLRLDQSESRYTSEFFRNTPDGSGFLGGAQWTNQYVTARAANNLMVKLKAAPDSVADAGKKAAGICFSSSAMYFASFTTPTTSMFCHSGSSPTPNVPPSGERPAK